VGDFNGDGYADVLRFNASTGQLSEWLLDGQGNVLATPILSSTCGSGCYPQWQVVGVGDFNGDGYADVLWFNASSGALVEWLLDGQGNVIATPIVSGTCGAGCSPPWQVVGVADFNGDGHADVLWFNASTGQLSEWLLDGQGNVIATPILFASILTPQVPVTPLGRFSRLSTRLQFPFQIRDRGNGGNF
jgi:hypothetical protein